LRNNGLLVPPDRIVCGTRGWILPDDPDYTRADEKIYLREAGRLRLSLEAAAAQRQPGCDLIACLHFPPFGRDAQQTLFTSLLEEFCVDRCIYGHIHSGSGLENPPGPAGTVRYNLVSADYLGFKPLRL